jgi:hypothetical protein
MRSLHKSRVSQLVSYLLDEQQKIDRVAEVSVSNCLSDDPVTASWEMEATQRRNRRAKSDRTFHLLVSWRADENPTPDQIRDVERTIAEGLGYGAHQRVSVVHRDTDNVHVHIAINKIHPGTFKYHEPHQFFRRLSELCAGLEQKHGFDIDNHMPERTRAENVSATIETSRGVESLLTWARRELAPGMATATDWQDLHRRLAERGCTIRPRGNGFTVTAQNGARVRASSIDRSLSRAALEARLGRYADPDGATAATRPSYSPRPAPAFDHPELFARYLADQKDRDMKRATFNGTSSDQLRSDIRKATASWQLRRGLIRAFVRNRPLKLFMYALAKRRFDAKVKDLMRQHRQRVTDGRTELRRMTWFGWLQQAAAAGDTQALSCLRRGRDSAPPIKGLPIDHVTKDGAITYRVGGTGVRDDGERLLLRPDADRQAIVAALKASMMRHGPRVKVTGSDQFQRKVAEVAALARLPLTFTDPALEAQRQHTLETLYGSRSRTTDVGEGSLGGAGQGRSVAGRSGHDIADAGNSRHIGGRPPAKSRNHLPTLSQLGVVRFTPGGEVLLPRDVSRGVEHPRAEPDHPLRRDVSGVESAAKDMTPAQRYIADRNARRAQISSIPLHRERAPSDIGPVTYSGIRSVDGQSLALLGLDNAVIVVPVSEYTAKRLQPLARGSTVHLNKAGEVRLKSRSRRL